MNANLLRTLLAIALLTLSGPVSTSPSEALAKTSSPHASAPALATEGDSISVTWGGNYTGIYAKARPAIRHCGLAVGGSTVESMIARAAGVSACNPDVLTILIGANGLQDASSTKDFLAKLFAYTDSFRKRGVKVAVATILPQFHRNNSISQEIFNSRRTVANKAIRTAVGSHIDAVIDFAADPEMGSTAAPSLYPDGTHPTDGCGTDCCGMGCGGQRRLAAIYAPVVDRLLRVH